MPSQLAQWIDAIAAVDPGADELEFEGHWQSWRDLIAAADALKRAGKLAAVR